MSSETPPAQLRVPVRSKKLGPLCFKSIESSEGHSYDAVVLASCYLGGVSEIVSGQTYTFKELLAKDGGLISVLKAHKDDKEISTAIFKAHITPEEPALTMPSDFAVYKFSWGEKGLKEQEYEFANFTKLEKLQGVNIPRLLGYFQGESVHGSLGCLVISYEGQLMEGLFLQYPINIREQTLKSLCALHHEGFAPCYNQTFMIEHAVISDDKQRVMIVGLDTFEPHDPPTCQCPFTKSPEDVPLIVPYRAMPATLEDNRTTCPQIRQFCIDADYWLPLQLVFSLDQILAPCEEAVRNAMAENNTITEGEQISDWMTDRNTLTEWYKFRTVYDGATPKVQLPEGTKLEHMQAWLKSMDKSKRATLDDADSESEW